MISNDLWSSGSRAALMHRKRRLCFCVLNVGYSSIFHGGIGFQSCKVRSLSGVSAFGNNNL